MGLDFSHCEAHWGYGGFNRFRVRIINNLGILSANPNNWPDFLKDERLVNDSIYPLLDHSDCDGELTVEECKIVAPRLRELIAAWNNDDYDKREALELIKGMELAIKNNENLEFC